MKEIVFMAIILISLFLVPSVLAFGEVAGRVVINVPIGGSGVGMWGLSNNETVNVKLRTEGDASNYLSLPSEVTVPANGIYWINVTANIPTNYNITQGTNITGMMYAVLEGSRGQVQINLQLEKRISILIEQPQVQEQTSFFTGFFALQPTFWIAGIIAVVVIFALIYFARKKKGVKK
jgi:hypothetical protein